MEMQKFDPGAMVFLNCKESVSLYRSIKIRCAFLCVCSVVNLGGCDHTIFFFSALFLLFFRNMVSLFTYILENISFLTFYEVTLLVLPYTVLFSGSPPLLVTGVMTR